MLIGGLLLIMVNVVRLGSATVASARGDAMPAGGEAGAVIELSADVARTVKYLVIPAVLLLIGGVLVRSGDEDGRAQELRAATGED